MTISLEALLGPFGLLVALIAAVGFLARYLFRMIEQRIADLTKERDTAILGWRESTTAVGQLTIAIDRLSEKIAGKPT